MLNTMAHGARVGITAIIEDWISQFLRRLVAHLSVRNFFSILALLFPAVYLLNLTFPIHVHIPCTVSHTLGRSEYSPFLKWPFSFVAETSSIAEINQRIREIERLLSCKDLGCPLRQEFHNIVNTAILRYAKDTVARRDFALHVGGAHSIPSLTSPTHTSMSYMRRWKLKLSSWMTDIDLLALAGHLPVVALDDELQPGACWAFSGSKGVLGIALSEEVHIQNITIDHIAADLTGDITQAPRHMVLWGRIDGEHNLAKATEYEKQNISSATRLSFPKHIHTDSAIYRPLANFQYDIYAPSNVQTFSVDPDMLSLGIGCSVVVLEVKHNWGSPLSTCLYRVRIHGEPIRKTV